MPRGHLPKKDAETGETWTGSCTQAMSRPTPNGATRADREAAHRPVNA
jgi:hypothetical protein